MPKTKKNKIVGTPVSEVNSGYEHKEAETVSTSPVPKKAKTIEMLNFYDALREAQNGKKVTRVSWNDNSVYIFIDADFLCIDMGKSIHQLIVSTGDMEGQDWFVLPEEENNVE